MLVNQMPYILDAFHLNFDDALFLKCLEHMLQHAVFVPPIHTYINCIQFPYFSGNALHLQLFSVTYSIAFIS